MTKLKSCLLASKSLTSLPLSERRWMVAPIVKMANITSIRGKYLLCQLWTAAHSTDAIKASGTAVSLNASTKFLAVWTSGFEVLLSPLCICWCWQIKWLWFFSVKWDLSTIIHSFPVWGAELALGAFGNRYWFELRNCDYYSHCARTQKRHGGHEILSSTWCVN